MKLKYLTLCFLVAFVAQAQRRLYPMAQVHILLFFADPTLNNHTIYQPRVIPRGLKMPVLVWSNGGCLSSGTIMFPFLVQIASQGIVVIVQGAPGNVTASYDSYATAPRSTSAMLIDAMDWAVQNSGKGNYTHMDASRIGVAGQSCGGLEAYTAINDSRASVIGIFNSGGNITEFPTTNPAKITKPIFYVLGGPTDIAYTAGESDYNSLPATTPAWKGNLPVGHGGTYNEVNGGEIGVAASYMYKWMLRGDSNSSSWFTVDTAASADGWEVVSKNLDKISVAPI